MFGCCTTALAFAVTTAPAFSAGGGGAKRGGGLGSAVRGGEMRDVRTLDGVHGGVGMAPRVVVFHGGFLPRVTAPTTVGHEPAAVEHEPVAVGREPVTVGRERVLDPSTVLSREREPG